MARGAALIACTQAGGPLAAGPCPGRSIEAMDRELLIELGIEELPASWLPPLTRQTADGDRRAVEDPPVGRWRAVGRLRTPRRLTVRVARVAERQSDLEELVNGPPVNAAHRA